MICFYFGYKINLRMEAGSGNALKGFLWALSLPYAFLLGEREKHYE